MIARLGRAVRRSYASIYPSRFNSIKLNRFAPLNFNPFFLFSEKSSMPPQELLNKKLEPKTTNQMQKHTDSASSINSTSETSKVQNEIFLKVLYQNPYFQQDNERQIVEQGFLAFHTSHVIRRIKYEDFFLRLPHQSIGEFILKLKDKIQTNQDENLGFLPKNIEQFYDAFKIDKGINLPVQIFGQNRLREVRSVQSLQVFNVTSVTCHIFKFANHDQKIYKDEFGIGKSFAFALNSYLTFLVSKMLMLFKEHPEERIKEMIIKHYYLFEEFHKQNKTITPTVDSLIKDFKRLRFQFYYELNAKDTWSKIIQKMLIQCPELKLNQKISEIIQTKNQLEKSQIQSFFYQLRQHFVNKKRQFLLNIDQGNIYYRRLNLIVNWQKIKKENNKTQKKQTVQVSVKKEKTNSQLFDKVNNKIQKKQAVQNTNSQVQFDKIYKQVWHISNILEILYTQLIQSNVKLCCSEKANIQLYKNTQFPVGLGYNPFSHSRIHLTKLQSQKDEQIFAWKQNELWYTLWFQIESLFYKMNPQEYLFMIQKEIQTLELKNIFYKTFIKTNKTQRTFEWGSKMKPLIIREIFQENYVKKWVLQLNNLILTNAQMPVNKTFVVDKFKELVEKLYYEINYLNIKSDQEKYNFYRLQIQNETEKPFSYFEGVFLDYLKRLMRQHKASLNKEMIITFDQIQHFFETFKLKLYGQAEKSKSFTRRQQALICQFLKNNTTTTQLQFRIEQKNKLIIKNPGNLLNYQSKKLINQQTLISFKRRWLQDNILVGKTFDNTFTYFVTSFPQKIRIQQLTLLIVNQKITFFTSLPRIFDIDDEKNHKYLFSTVLQQLQEGKGSMKVGQSLALRPIKINKQQQYDPASPCIDLMIATKTSEKVLLLRTVDLTVSKTKYNVQTKKKSILKFIMCYLMDNIKFDKEYEHQHWIVCPHQIAKQIKDEKYEIKNQQGEIIKIYSIKIISLNDIQLFKPDLEYRDEFMVDYQLLLNILKFIKENPPK